VLFSASNRRALKVVDFAFSSIDIPSMPLVSFFFLSMLKVNSQLTEDESGAD